MPEVGAQLEVVVARFDTEQGLYEVSLPTAAVSVGNWDEVEEGQIVDVTITGSNKGGLECQVAGIRGFIPLGQVSIFRVENPEEYVGQRLSCVITEAKRSRKNLVLSHRVLMERERKEQREKNTCRIGPGANPRRCGPQPASLWRLCRFGRRRRLDTCEPAELGARRTS